MSPLSIDKKEIGIGTCVLSLAVLCLVLVASLSDESFNQKLFAVVGHPFGPSPRLYVILFIVAVWP